VDSLKILFAGESWFTYSVHQKGFDTFETAEYSEGATRFLEMLSDHGHAVTYVPAHRVDPEFPVDVAGLSQFDVTILSDVGANTFLLPKRTFSGSENGPNRLEVLREYVTRGGALLMIGGYMSFSGIGGRARYGASPIADLLPVALSETDDRIEVPEGFVATVVSPDHPALAGVPTTWPSLLGYNRFRATDGSSELVRRGADPILVVGDFGAGRTAAFASDLAPHWAPPEFVDWEGYPTLWLSLLAWLGRRT
jgi:uncharacterized membrane protein